MSRWPEGSCGEKPCCQGSPMLGGPGHSHAVPCLELLGEEVAGTGAKVSEATRSRRSGTGVPYCYQIMSALGGGGRADSSGHPHGATWAGYSAKRSHFGIVEAGYQPRQAVCSYTIVCTLSVKRRLESGPTGQ